MEQNTAIEAVRFFGQRLSESGVRVAKLILFGFHGRGQGTEDSDVNVLVISEDFRGKDIFQKAEMIGDSESETIRRFVVPIDVLMMTPEEFDSGASLMAQAAREGTIVLPDPSEAVSKTSAD